MPKPAWSSMSAFLGASVLAVAIQAIAADPPKTTQAVPAPDKSSSAWWGDIKVLASDEFQGRLTGSSGYRKAAEFVEKTFEREGLKPAGTDGFFQRVGFETQLIDVATSRVQLTKPGAAPTDVSDEVVISPGVIQRPDVAARLVFVGYGIHMPELGFDDFAGLDIRNAVVVYLVGGPSTLTGAQRAHAYSEVLSHYLEGAGAQGVVGLTAPKNREVPWARQKAAGAQPGMVLEEKALRRYQGPMFSAAFDESKAQALFAGSGHRFDELVELAGAHKPLPHFALSVGITAHIEATTSKVASDNVVGELPGTDPALAGEAVVLTAHLDHLGVGKPDHGDGVFRGAMDDASGVATLIEVAREMQGAKAKPRRSLLFVAVCGEEKGLLGSRYFAAHPSRHAGHIVADLNTDMFLPLYPLTRVVGFGADESSLGRDLAAVGKEMHIQVVPDPQPDHLIFVRADQYSFVRKGTPALMMEMTPTPGTSEQATYDAWFQERYHAQADNLDQPVDLAAAEAFTKLMYRLALRVADEATAPTWNKDSFFARLAQNPLP